MFPLKDDIPTRRYPIVTVCLIAINVIIYIYQHWLLAAQGQMIFLYKYAFIPVEYTHFVELTPELAVPYGVSVVSSMFLHGGFLHLAGNMLYLWIFGNNIEDFLGRFKFIIFYLLSGLAAVVLFTLVSPSSEVPLIGASGAIAGALGAYMVLYPRARILVLLFLGFLIQTVRVPARFLLGFWFIYQLFASLTTGTGGGGVAWFAHVGGFAFGYLYFRLTKKRSNTIWHG